MTDESLSKSFQFSLTQDFAGYVSSVDPTKVSENVMVRGSQNIIKKLSGTLSVRDGMKRRGATNAAVSPISSEFIYNTSWGETLPIIVSENKLQVEYQGAFYTLLSGLTKTRYVFDKWWDDTAKKDKLIFVKGDSDLQSWSGGVTTILSATASTITKLDSTVTWQQAGFTATGSILINGTTYTYTGGYGTDTLTGVTPNPSAEPTLSIALQTVVTDSNTPAAGYNNDFVKVINNQAYVGSYSSRLIYISANDDFTNFTIPATPVPGSADSYVLDSSGKGIGVRTGNAFVSYGSGEWVQLFFTNYTDASGVLLQKLNATIFPVSKLGAAYAHEFIGNSGDNIIYLAQDQQVRTLGNFNNLFTTGYPSLSQEINTELAQANFTGGGLKCIGDYIFVTAPVTGKVYLYQVRQRVDNAGNVVNERLWHSPQIWNATRIDEIDGIIYAFSNANPQIYQIFDTEQWFDDSPTDEELPYACILAFGYRNLGQFKGGARTQLLQFDKNYTEGYIEPSTNLDLIINYEYEGAKTILTAPVNSSTRLAVTYGGTAAVDTGAASLGDESLGGEPLGDGISSAFVDDMAKFRTINCFALHNVFEFQPTYQSDQAGARWEILATGTNLRAEETQPNYLINKA